MQKLQNSAFAEFWDCTPVLALELGTLFPNSAQAEFAGFGSRRLIGQGFLDAKAPLDPRKPFLFFATGGLGLWLGALG